MDALGRKKGMDIVFISDEEEDHNRRGDLTTTPDLNISLSTSYSINHYK